MQVRIGDEAVDIERDGDAWRVAGRAVEVHAAPAGPRAVHLLVDGRSRVVTVERLAEGRFRATVGGLVVEGTLKDPRALLMERFGLADGAESAERTVRAPMPGLVVRVLVAAGDAVEAGQGVVVLEAMKMENELKAPVAGTVAVVHALPGAAVSKGDLLLEIGEPARSGDPGAGAGAG